MKIARLLAAASAAFFFASSALAQTSGTVTNHAFAIGKGAGQTGFTSLLCASTQIAIGQTSANPACAALSGDVTMNASGVTAIGTAKVTNAMLATMAANTTKCNATGGSASPTDCNASTMRTNIGVVIGTDVQAFDADLAALAANSTDGLWAHTGAGTGAARTLTGPAAGITVSNGNGVSGNPTLALANDLSALEGLGGTGIARRTGTDAWSVGTAVANSELATMNAYTFKGNNTGSSATPTDVDIAALTTKASPAAGDYVILSDQAASGAWKKATVSSISSAGSVSSIDGATGAFTTNNGITTSANAIGLTAARRTLPTTQRFLSGSGTYTTPANVLWIEVQMLGGGGGAAGAGTGGGNGTAGGSTCWNTSGAACTTPVYSAGGGAGGTAASSTGAGAGGTAGGSSTCNDSLPGGPGQNGSTGSPTVPIYGGNGGVGRGGGNSWGSFGSNAANAASTNTGGGGGGAGSNSSITNSASGGGAGAYCYFIINSPAASYTYAVGTGGAAGTTGTSAGNSGAGGSGNILVIEHYGS